MNVPNPKETFVHTRSSKQYVIEMLSRDEATGKPLVTYTGVETGVTWTRPLEMFMGWADGAPRFERMVNAQATEAAEAPVRSQGQQITELVSSSRLMHLEVKVGELEGKLSDVQSVLRAQLYQEKFGAADQSKHWNSPQSLPPVGCDLVVKLPAGTYKHAAEGAKWSLMMDLDNAEEVTVRRICHVQQRGNDLTYMIQGDAMLGFMVKGQFEWTYP